MKMDDATLIPDLFHSFASSCWNLFFQVDPNNPDRLTLEGVVCLFDSIGIDVESVTIRWKKNSRIRSFSIYATKWTASVCILSLWTILTCFPQNMGISCFQWSMGRIDTFGELKQILPTWREEMRNLELFKVWVYCCFPSHSRSTITSFSIPAKLRQMECERDSTQTAQFFSGECCLVSNIPFSLPIPRLFSPNGLAKRGSITMNGRWASCSSNSTRAFPIPPPSSVKSVLSCPFLSHSHSRLLAASNSTFSPIPFPCLFAQTHHISTAVSFFSSSWMCTQQKSPLSHASTIYASRASLFLFPTLA